VPELATRRGIISGFIEVAWMLARVTRSEPSQVIKKE